MAFVRYTKNLVQMGIHKVVEEASEALGEQAGDSLDQLTRAVLAADTTTVQYANGRASTATILNGDVMTFTEIMKMIATLRTAKARGVMPDGKFAAIVHPKTVYDMFSDSVFQMVLSYVKERGESNPFITGHIGDAFGVSFYESPNAYVNSAAGGDSQDIYSTMVLGKAAFGVGGLAAYMPQVIREDREQSNHTFETVKPLQLINHDFGSTGTADPFNRLASTAWYTTFVAKVLDGTFFGRIEHDTTL